MRIKKILGVLVFLPLSSFAQPGSISGEVFYKYNEYVGNRPDAGASIAVYSLKTPRVKKSTITDLSGAFSVPNLDTGEYLVIIESKETNSDPYDGYQMLLIYSRVLEKYFDINIKGINPPLQNELDGKFNSYANYLMSSKAKAKKASEMKMEIINLVFKLFGEIPIEKLIEMGISLPTDKIHFEEVTVDNQTPAKIIVDFGITNR